MTFSNEKELLALPIDKRALHKDTFVKCLYLEIGLSNKGFRRTFYFRYTIKKRLKVIKIGTYPKISLPQARKIAIEYNNNLELGETLKVARKVSEMTILELFNEWYFIFSKQYVSRTFAKRLKNHIIDFYKDKSIKEFNKEDVLLVFDRLYGENKIHTIYKIYSNLKSMLNYAINKDYIEYTKILNINLRILYGNEKRENYRCITDISRLKDLLLAIEKYSGNIFTKTALQISPYVFLRSANVRALEWKEVDFCNKRLNIGASKMKGREDFIVPLSDSVLEKLNFIKLYSGHCRFVFPSDISKAKCMCENTLNQAIKRLGFGDEMVYHGFRSTASTLLYEFKREHKQDSEVIELCLDHRERNKVKAAYNRSLRLDDRIELMQWWSDFLDNLKIEKK